MLSEKDIECEVIIRSKDVLEELLKEDKIRFKNILPEGRKSGKAGIIIGLLKRDLRLFKYVFRKKYDIFVGTDPSLAHIGFIKRIPVITVLEDDIEIVPELARITFPFTTTILTPVECNTGRFEKKTIRYEGYMKLAYLHPNWFRKEPAELTYPYFLIRISKLDAYHDNGIKGLTKPLVHKLINLLKRYGDVYISTEGKLDESLKRFELPTRPSRIHHVLANAKMLISDSQSMTMEAAMLGIPSIRYSDFTGKISVLETMEKRYLLTFGIIPGNDDMLFNTLIELLNINDLERIFSDRRERMLGEKIDVTNFLVWFLSKYPSSTIKRKYDSLPIQELQPG
jgi:predicted glycosyltransferase